MSNLAHLYMKKATFILLFILGGLVNTVPVLSQVPDDFAASRLQEVAREYAGAEVNWPIVAALASYDVNTNRFRLDAADRNQLNQFRNAFQQFKRAERRYANEISEGAKVFAPDEMDRCDSLFSAFQSAVKRGNYDQSLDLSSVVELAVENLAEVNSTNRKEEVEARLSEKSGTVLKREGVLGQWITAILNDFFAESDGVQTKRESRALLSFRDGSEVLVSPQTTAIIRTSRLDKLTQSAETEITIENGSLLSRLSAQAQQSSDFRIFAENSVTTVRSGKFWADNSSNERVSYANYDGTATVEANNRDVVLQRNQGTIVVRGQEPSPPIELLPSPKLPWPRLDSVIYRDRFQLSWNTISEAEYYEVDHSTSKKFESNVNTYRSQDNTLTLNNIPLQISYVQIRAFDENGLRGNDSPTYRILRNKDIIPPALFFKGADRGTAFSVEDTYTLTGITEPGTQLIINEKALSVGQDGSFDYVVDLAGKQRVELRVLGKDRSGNEAIENISIFKIDPEQLFNVSWSTESNENGIVFQKGPINITGKAYPRMEAVLNAGSETYTARSDNSGRWAITFSVAQGVESVTLSFRKAGNEKIIAQKTFSIQ